MEVIFSILQTVLIFVAAIFILVLVHELGHFLAAKLFGMRVERFSIGFPPRLVGVKKGDTDYCISALPLGGYVKISGMVDESMDDSFEASEPKDYEYRSKPVWQRMIVITAGVIFNMLLAYAIFAVITFSHGVNQIPAENIQGMYIPDTSTAADVGFETGDRLVAVNDKEIEYVRRGQFFSMSDITSRSLSFTVERDGEMITIEPPADFLDYLARNPEFLELQNALPSKVGAVAEDTPAEKAGLQEGDEIIAIDGEEIGYWAQMVEKIQAGGEEMLFTVRRNSDTLEKTISPEPERRVIGIAIVDPHQYFGYETISFGVFGSIREGVNQAHDTLFGIINGFRQLLTGTISVRENLGGPVAIASVTAEVTERGGALGFWNFTAFLSITLALMNILPIPMLDGGHLMFLIYEAVTRREPSMKVRMALQQIGFILLISLMIFVTFNDILRHVVN
ncbi:RIP metalloprotease RseP [Natronogracilivirga saccharolytica]|uniref:Zinc metalloprotease n=1 Tax=Natronogracilivirga saccharolytica TaxID=2812953 RepID=A0A8J7UUH2_9BACT|nr:RIP metalloprotease RseP [Natronogracilivirga saccharolytica]MBP3192425.1 RIP metalloprotease RseP [Natronogracilivirga saccharolytica]